MPYIKVQKLVFNNDGSIHSGSASILVSSYDKSIKDHSSKTVRERLGKILYINEGHSCGIFLSPTRGLVEYDAEKDEFASVDSSDPRLPALSVFPDPPVHTIFGDAYLVLGFAERCGMVSVLRDAFTNTVNYEKVLCHLLHTMSSLGNSNPLNFLIFLLLLKCLFTPVFCNILVFLFVSDKIFAFFHKNT